MKKLFKLKQILIILTFNVSLFSANANKILLKYGDIAQIAMPIYSFSYTFYKKDSKGSLKFAELFSISQATVYLLKQTNEERPKENEHGKSFPSGHTEAAFFAAAFLDYRYDISSKYLFYSMASLVAVSRVTNKQHWPHDVLGGALIGIYYNKLFTKPFKNNETVFIPFFVNKTFCIAVNKKI
ncbi:MAG TPA: phosphatase PAP2 family protein [Elusimicrobiales bacterium]|nr:phosphatase PAP2 family protein [Elusimicrobiales bacterium]HOL63648.1 phosphatase PAP2 family protein [Elusimicrobiales bacterium]HPO94963.1 phosphatase PAP2 family protein [Elusimicrobiales bacterium]